MKKLIFVSLLIVAISTAFNSIAVAQIVLQLQSLTAKVGQQPIAIIPAKISGTFEINPDTLNIICLGYDANFNGEFNEEDGDELPSWWKIERIIDANPFSNTTSTFNTRKVMDFDMNWDGFFPFRNRITEVIDKLPTSIFGNVLPIPSKDGITFYDMSTEKRAEYYGILYPELVDENIKSFCSYSDVVFTTRRVYDNPGDWNPSRNVLTMYSGTLNFQKKCSYESQNQNIQRVIAYTNPSIDDPNITIAVLYEEEYGSESTIEFHTPKMPLEQITDEMSWEDCFDIKEIKVGNTVNDMVLLTLDADVPYLFVVSSGDNRIYVIDENLEINGSGIGIDNNYIEIPTEFPNSIREVSFKINTPDLPSASISATISSYDGYTYYINNIFDYNPNNFDTISSKGINYTENFKIKHDLLSDASYIFKQFGDEIGVMFAHTLNMDAMYGPKDEVEIFYTGYTNILEYNNSLKVFPNPTRNVVNFELEKMSDINFIRLFDNEGKDIKILTDYSIDGNIIQINIPTLPLGNYFIELNTKQQTYIQKIIVL